MNDYDHDLFSSQVIDYCFFRCDIAKSAIWRKRWMALAKYRQARGHHYVKYHMLPNCLKF